MSESLTSPHGLAQSRRTVGRIALLGCCVWLLFFFTEKAWMWPTGIAVAATFLLLGGILIFEFAVDYPRLSRQDKKTGYLKLSRTLFQGLAIAAVIYSFVGRAWSQAVVLAVGICVFVTLWINSELRKRGALAGEPNWTVPLFGRRKCRFCWVVSMAVIAGLCIFIGITMPQ